MRHFTREMYEKMQIMGRFPLSTDNKEKWMKQLEGFCSVCHVNDKVYDALMFKYIPEVEDDILQGKKFTDKEVSEKLYTSIKGMANELENVHKMYKAEYLGIRYKLPLGMQKLENYIFHDDTVVSLKKDSRDILKLELQSYSLTFKNISQLEITDDIIGDSWLYDEVHLSDRGNFEFEVLLYSPQGFLTLHEFGVVADDILIEAKDNN